LAGYLGRGSEWQLILGEGEKWTQDSQVIYTFWHVTIRNSDGRNDIWSEDFSNSIAEGYPPIEGTGWIFFLIKKDSALYLYFQPDLITSDQIGIRTSGAYFKLFDQP
jgi:hypothetical protein